MDRAARHARKRGNRLGLWFFRTSIRLFGLRGAYGLLYPVCLYYLLFDRPAVSSASAYLRRRFGGQNALWRLMGTYRLLINQGKNLIDRHCVISGMGRFDIEIRGYDKIEKILKGSNRGFILLTAHVGNWQVTMTALEKCGKRVHLLMHPEENIAVRDALDIDGEKSMVKIISTKGHLGGIIEALKAVEEGDIVSIMGDRSYGFGSVEVDFLGGRAAFPYGAFSLASAARCRVVSLFSAKVSPKKYVVEIARVTEPKEGAKKEEKLRDAEAGVCEFAGALQDFLLKHPYQWFVFHDIWEKAEEAGREINALKEHTDGR